MSGIEISKKTERGSFQVFNVKYENIYETENETIVLLSKKWWRADFKWIQTGFIWWLKWDTNINPDLDMNVNVLGRVQLDLFQVNVEYQARNVRSCPNIYHIITWFP